MREGGGGVHARVSGLGRDAGDFDRPELDVAMRPHVRAWLCLSGSVAICTVVGVGVWWHSETSPTTVDLVTRQITPFKRLQMASETTGAIDGPNALRLSRGTQEIVTVDSVGAIVQCKDNVPISITVLTSECTPHAAIQYTQTLAGALDVHLRYSPDELKHQLGSRTRGFVLDAFQVAVGGVIPRIELWLKPSSDGVSWHVRVLVYW